MAYGTLIVADLLRTRNANILEYGERQAFEQIQRGLDAYNMLTRDMLATLVEPTTDRIRGYGTVDTMVMVKSNEFGRADVQKVTAGANLGFPLRMSQASVQWTRKWFQNHTPAELAAQYLAIQQADTQEIAADLKTAFFGSANYTFKDDLIDSYSLSVKALINADSSVIPYGPNGETFNGATHTHYLATAALAAADISALVLTVAEHYNRGQVYVYINQAQEATVRGFNAAGQFVALNPVELIPAENTVRAGIGALDTKNLYNRFIGYWGTQAARVWVKPWVPANYILAYIDGVRKVLVMRERAPGSGNLIIQADDEAYPLRCQTLEREMGFAVQERTAAAVLYTGGGSYVDPTF